LNWLREEDHPSFIGRFDAARHAVFFWLVRHKLIANQSIQSLPDFNRSHRGMAIGALPELDHTGRLKAVPTLIRMLGEKSHWPDEVPPTAYSALIVLSKMAPESTAPLIQALSSRDPQVWAMAAGGLGEIGPGASAAIPVLEQRLADKDPMIRVGAARVICKLGGDPNAYLPVVIQSLNEVDLTNLFFPLEVLLQYKQHAHAAVPALTSILNKTRASTNVTSIVARNQVIQALKEIDPEK
jgi:HEAT repeat protein